MRLEPTRWRGRQKQALPTMAASRNPRHLGDREPLPSVSWWDRPAVPIPPAPPGEHILARAYDTRRSFILRRAITTLFFVGLCSAVALFYHRSVLIPAIVISCVGYGLLVLGNPPRAISVGADWLRVRRGGRRSSAPWVRTGHLAELCLDEKSGHVIRLRDHQGRDLSVRLRDLSANQFVYALFVRAVRQSYHAGMRTDRTAARALHLDMPVIGEEIAVDEDGRPMKTYFAVHLLEEGPGSPISVIRRTPGEPLPTDESSDGHGGWLPEGYLYQFLGFPEGITFSRIPERRALGFVESSTGPGRGLNLEGP